MNRAGLTGQQAMILHNYLKAREDEITEQATDACISWIIGNQQWSM